MGYFIISTSCDGIYIDEVSKEEVLDRLAKEYYGSRKVSPNLPTDSDPMYWGESLVIIKGEVVKPTPKKVVTEWEI